MMDYKPVGYVSPKRFPYKSMDSTGFMLSQSII